MEKLLGSSEQALVSRLLEILPGVVTSGSMMFFPAKFRPETIRPHWVPAEADELYESAIQSLALRERLGLDSSGSVGQLYLAACEEAANGSDHNRLGPRRLAERLLLQVQQAQSQSNISLQADRER
jgi:hypothetical protein